MRLSRYEKETIILLNAAEDTASIYTADPVWKRKLDKLVEKNPQCYQCVKADEVSKTYSMPKRFISLPLYGLPFPSEGMACRSTKRAVRTRHRTPYTVQAGNHLTVFFLRL